MILKTRLFGNTYEFGSVKEVLAKANEEKSGDKLAGVAAASAEERVAAKTVLAQLTLNDLFNNPVVPYDEDEVTRIIIDQVNTRIFDSIKNWTVEELREWLLSDTTTDNDIKFVRRALTAEMIAAVCKLMSNMDLIVAAKKIRIEKTANTTIGRPGTFSARLQPNHTTDNIDGIMASVMEGLSYGIGDAVIGLNPVDDSVESVKRILHKFEEFRSEWDIPTQTCVLAHVTTQMEAIRQGAPVLKLAKEDEQLKASELAAQIRSKLDWYLTDDNQLTNVALSFQGIKSPSFADIQRYAMGITEGVAKLREAGFPLLIIVTEDMAKALGNSIYSMLPEKSPFVCIDSIVAENGDYIDIGTPVAGGNVLPVIIKTLVFN